MSTLKIASVEATALRESYGTPLYVYDVDNMKSIISDYKTNFKSNKYKTAILFASKSFCVKEMLRLVNEEDLCLDVVSMGEYFTANSISFPNDKIYFHGNNKSYEELTIAIENNVKEIVVDNYMELCVIKEISEKINKTVHILLRLNVGVDAHTHKYIVTSHIDSKFGIIIDSEDYQKCLKLINESKNIVFDGIHCHIGSQIFDMSGFFAEIDKLLDVAKRFTKPLVIDLGGGFGVRYTEEDKPIPFSEVSKMLIDYVDDKIAMMNLTIDTLAIEPGRSIVAESGYTLYTIGYKKVTPNKEYYFVDGGMTDNIRPALYQAKYNCDIANKMDLPKTKVVTIAGKCCESGDVIIEKCLLPEAETGDLLVTYSTGAYGYSMSSNYNKALTPAVVFVSKGNSKLVVKRQTYEDLIEREI